MNLEQLTATEAQIAGLIANGRNDGEITARLALEPHAGERHLGEIFRKLGIYSRAELALLLGHVAAHESQQGGQNMKQGDRT